MARVAILLAAVVALATAAALWWWTAAAMAPTAVLVAELRAVAPFGDGALAVAQPARAGRWLFRHPEAGALLALAAPGTLAAGRRVATPARALAQAAEGPLAVWWRGDELAIAASVDAGARRGLAELAALQGLAAAEVEGRFAVASAPELLTGNRSADLPATPANGAAEHATALAWDGQWVWRVNASGGRLVAVSGHPGELPSDDGPSTATTSSGGPLLDAAGLGRFGLGERVTLIVDDDRGWGLWLGDARLSKEVGRLLGVRDGSVSDVHRTQGPFGEVWWRAGDGLAVATDEQLLAALDTLGFGEHGHLRGAEVAAALVRLSGMIEPLPGFAARASALRRATESIRGLDRARWRITRDGGIIVLEW